MLEIGALVDDKYRILDEVGRGGMSVVYLARNIRTNKQWAIKEIRKDGTNDFDIVRSNLIAETDILKKLNHPNLPNIIDILDDDDSFIIIMDFIEGNSLQYHLKHSGAQQEEDVVQWVTQLCDVLGYLHSRKPPIIYRDMKPANVMLKPDGNVCLIDFGTAREYKETAIEDTTTLGTRGYAAPEQYGGHGQTDARTDVFNLGATMYHLITGHNPAQPPYEMKPIRTWNPALSESLEQIILKCTQQDPEDRYQSCEELMYALEHYKELEPERRRTRIRRLATFCTSMTLTILFTAGFFGFSGARASAISDSYENNVDRANRLYQDDYDTAMELYKNAIQLSRGRPEVYESLLNNMIVDSKFESAEASAFQNVLNGTGDGDALNRVLLEQENPAAYANLCYNLGIAYMLMYEGSDYNNPKQYLKVAMESPYLREPQPEVAECLYNMCGLYQLATSGVSLAGSSTDGKTFADYWEDIETICGKDLDVIFEGMDIAQVQLFRFIVARIDGSANRFYSDGVSTDAMYAMIDLAEETIQKIVSRNSDLDSGFSAMNSDDVNFESARNRVAAVVNAK